MIFCQGGESLTVSRAPSHQITLLGFLGHFGFGGTIGIGAIPRTATCERLMSDPSSRGGLFFRFTAHGFRITCSATFKWYGLPRLHYAKPVRSIPAYPVDCQ